MELYAARRAMRSGSMRSDSARMMRRTRAQVYPGQFVRGSERQNSHRSGLAQIIPENGRIVYKQGPLRGGEID